MAERLDRIRLLHQCTDAHHAHRREGVGDRDGKEQSIWHQTRDNSRVLYARHKVDTLEQRSQHQEELAIEDEEEGDADHPVDFALEWRYDPAKCFGPVRDLAREAHRAHRRRAVIPATDGAERPGIYLVTLALLHMIRFAGQQ